MVSFVDAAAIHTKRLLVKVSNCNFKKNTSVIIFFILPRQIAALLLYHNIYFVFILF